jgi:SAM-dependent methyltransferase
MPSCHCEATDRHFTPTRAREELATYRRRGPTGTARLILQSLAELGLTAETVLDIGAGIGVLHHELLEHGLQHAVHVEAAMAYVEVAKEEAARRGHQDRVSFLHGDAVWSATELAAADLVTLDRVVCCWPDLEGLMQVSMQKAKLYYALSYPHDRWYVRGHTWWQNLRRGRAGNPFRTFVHPVSEIRALVQAAGFDVRRSCSTLIWEVLVCKRRDAKIVRARA